MNQAAVLRAVALTYGDRPAVSKGKTAVRTYRQFADRVARLAAALTTPVADGGLGLARGDRVGLVMKNCPAYFEVMYGCWHAGLAAVPINAKLHPKELAYILEHSGAGAAFVTGDMQDAVSGEAGTLPALAHVVSVDDDGYEALISAHAPAPVAETSPDDLAWLFYTSGTTGRPKGAMLTHRVLSVTVMNYLADVDGIEPEDCIVHAAPMSHGSGIYGLPHVARAANNVIPESGGYGVAETLDLIAHWPGCSFFFAPTMVTRLINSELLAGADTTNLKTIIYGGGPMYLEDTLKALDAVGPKLVQIYGQGEAPMTITGLPKRIFRDRDHPRWEERLASAGHARTDVEVRVVDPDGKEVATREIGEVTCRGDIVMAGYWRNPEATAATIRDGWLWTGDMGAMDAEGFLTLKDRSKDMIISGGTNIYPREIEEVLLTHPGVYECAVVGRPHADWGEEVVAFVVRREGAAVTADDLDRLCLDNIARFKRPKEIRFVPSLAKNNYGKILKTALRDLMAAESAAE